MKLALLLAFVALAAAAPQVYDDQLDFSKFDASELDGQNRSIMVNILVRQLLNMLLNIIKNGSENLGIPVLDPLVIEQYNLEIPTGIVNLNLDLKNVLGTGLGQFEVNKSDLDLRALTFDVDFTFPGIQIEAAHYDMVGNFYNVIPLYGRGRAMFRGDFGIRAVFYLKQSDDKKSILIDRIENTSVYIPHFESHLTGAIGGGDIDAIVNAVIVEGVIDYVNRFHGAVGNALGRITQTMLNPLLDGLDTWRFIAPLIPRN